MLILGYYQDEGELDKAIEYISRLFLKSESPVVAILKLRIAVMLSPVCSSWDQMVIIVIIVTFYHIVNR